ncbi:MAG: sugar phosphorylase, partial [Chloroflexota bacterium]
MDDLTAILLGHLVALYGDATGRAAFERLQPLLERYRRSMAPFESTGLTGRDAILITYADQVNEPNVPPLRTLAKFCKKH